MYLFKSQITITPIASPVTAILNARDKDIVVILFRWASKIDAGVELKSILLIITVYVCTVILPDKWPIHNCPQSGADPKIVI